MDVPRKPGLHALEWDARHYLLYVPARPITGLIVAFHPFGATPELVIDGEPVGNYLIRELEGLRGPAEGLGFAVLLPRAVGRTTPAISLSWAPHLDGAWDVARRARDAFRLESVHSGGLSMGGMEALSFAARHPEETGSAWAVNPIIDLAKWYRDRPDESVIDEVGGDPDSVPAEYRARSPISYAAELARTRVRLVWSPADTVIPNQASAHAHRLAGLIADCGGLVDEVVVTHEPSNRTMDAGRFAHEACDVWEAMAWTARSQLD